MTFEKALEAMRKGKKIWNKNLDKEHGWSEGTYLAISDDKIKFYENNCVSTDYPYHLNPFLSGFILSDDWEIYEPEKKVEPDAFSNLEIKPGKALNNFWFVKANEHTKEYAETVRKKMFEAYKLEPCKVDSTMYSTIEITFKSGDTIRYNKDEWDDYSYDGKSVCVKKDGAWVGIYNFDHVFSVELKNGE